MTLDHIRRLCMLLACSAILQLGSLFSETLGDRFQRAHAGDFVVLSHDKHLTLFHILEKDEQEMIIEEITLQERFASAITSWKEWIQQKAPFHTRWALFTFQLPSFRHVSTRSYPMNQTMSSDTQISFLPTLFTLPLHKITVDDRKKVGPPPRPDEQDRRKIWNPPIFFNGKQQLVPSTAYTTTIPINIPDIGGKKIDLYFPTGDSCLNYFPYWIEIRGIIAKVKLRAIDSGQNMSSPAASKASYEQIHKQ